MAISRVDTKLTTDASGVASRVLTKPTSANLVPGDWTILAIAGNLNPPPSITQLPVGFNLVGPRVTDGGGPNTHLDVYARQYATQSEIDNLASEDWTAATGANADKWQVPTVTYRGVHSLLLEGFLTSNEAEATSALRHSSGGYVGSRIPGCVLLGIWADRLTGGVNYTQVGTSDDEVIENIGPGANAMSVFFTESPALAPGSYSRRVDVSVSSVDAVSALLLLRPAGATAALGTPMPRRYNGSAWAPVAKTKRYNGSTHEHTRPVRF